MKRKELLKKALIYSIIGATVAGNTVPAYAYTNSVGNVETGTVTAPTDAESCEVYATLASSFKVTIPKKITLDGGTKKGIYTVDVEGDIGGTDVIKVVPDPSVALNSTNLASVTASISQDKTEWSYGEILANSDKVIGNGSIDASGITAGVWNGTFNFNVEYESTESETPVTLEAGLYDANGVMLCSWEESGIDVETDYSDSNYETSTTSGYYVLTNNYPTATKVVIPDSVTGIGERVFFNCTGLTSVTIGNGVTSIGNSAFNGCTNLTSITIPDSVITIGIAVFYNCTGLTSVTIGSNVTNIGNGTFYGCTNLTSIEIPKSVTTIGDQAFDGCTSLTNATIPESVRTIGAYAFRNCTSLNDITIPDSVTSIGNYAFAFCSSLTNITIPDNVTSIGTNAFYQNTSLTNVIIGNGVTNINDAVFSGCTDLTNLSEWQIKKEEEMNDQYIKQLEEARKGYSAESEDYRKLTAKIEKQKQEAYNDFLEAENKYKIQLEHMQQSIKLALEEAKKAEEKRKKEIKETDELRGITEQLKQEEKQIQKEIQDKIVVLTKEKEKYEQAILNAAKEYDSLDYKAKMLARIELALHNKEMSDIEAIQELRKDKLDDMIRAFSAQDAPELSRIRKLFMSEDER